MKKKRIVKVLAFKDQRQFIDYVKADLLHYFINIGYVVAVLD